MMMIEPVECIGSMKARAPARRLHRGRIAATGTSCGWYPLPVIPSGWAPVQRADGEHVGYLVPDGPAGLVLPVTLVGAALGPPQDRVSATVLLAARGLSSLDRRWWCRLPDTLPVGVLAAGEPPAEWDWRPVVLVEVSPASCLVRPEWAAPDELTASAELPVPVGGLLRASAGG
jgi:hypothetical protein